jgi:hypothetical protein
LGGGSLGGGFKSLSGGLGSSSGAGSAGGGKVPGVKSASWAPQTAPAPVGSLPSAALGVTEDEASQENSEATRVVPYDESEEEAAHFAHVYDEFLQLKKQCGETTAGLTIDKFLQKLRDNKSSLVAKHACRTVRFSVYVKDGKAALKATPVRE